jgi:hypothetical protein
MSFTIGSHLKQVKEAIRAAAAAANDSILVVSTSGISVKSTTDLVKGTVTPTATAQVYLVSTAGASLAAPQDLIQGGSFAGFVDVTAGANVTGFTVPATYKAAKFLAYIYRDATSDLYEVVELNLVNKAGTWTIATADAVGDDSAVDFSVSSSGGVGQVRYASTTIAGHSATLSTIEWKLISYI